MVSSSIFIFIVQYARRYRRRRMNSRTLRLISQPFFSLFFPVFQEIILWQDPSFYIFFFISYFGNNLALHQSVSIGKCKTGLISQKTIRTSSTSVSDDGARPDDISIRLGSSAMAGVNCEELRHTEKQPQMEVTFLVWNKKYKRIGDGIWIFWLCRPTTMCYYVSKFQRWRGI